MPPVVLFRVSSVDAIFKSTILIYDIVTKIHRCGCRCTYCCCCCCLLLSRRALGHAGRYLGRRYSARISKCCSPVTKSSAPANPTTPPLRRRVNAVMLRDISPRRLYCRHHRSEWPSFDHASSLGINKRVSSTSAPLLPKLPLSGPHRSYGGGAYDFSPVGL